MKKIGIFFCLTMLAACNPLNEKNESNIIIPRIEHISDADNASYRDGSGNLNNSYK